MPLKDNKNRLKSLLCFAPYLRPHRFRLVFSLFLLLVGSGGAMFFPYATGIALDKYIIPHHIQGFLPFVALTAGIMILSGLANAYRVRTMSLVGQDSIRRMRLDLFKHLQKLPLSYFDRMPVGKVMTRLTSDFDALSELLSGAIIQILGDILTFFGFLVIMFSMDWRMALMAVVVLPPMLYAFTFLSSRIHKAEDEVREKASVVNATLQENLSGIKVIQAFCASGLFSERFDGFNQSLFRAGLRATIIFGFFWPIIDSTWVFSTGLLLVTGGHWVIQGTLTIGTLAAIMGYASEFFGPLRSLSQSYRLIQRALAGAVRIREVLQQEEEHFTAPPMPPIRGVVEFAGVTFGYQSERPVLADLSLRAQPGEMVALVGHTGAGKTSIINLLCRFYLPQKGRILIDGMDINQTDLESYRSQIALVLQEPFLFSGTVRENLCYGKPGATEAELRAALTAAGLDESFASQGFDLDSVLTERGGNLSTGQRQLLSFARAILTDPGLIILDEATAHVDTLTERRVQAAMASLLAGRTSFVIAHRLSTIQAADQILLIEDGQIVERGTHRELIEAQGRYWALCREQNAFSRGELDQDDEDEKDTTNQDEMENAV